MKKAGGYFGSDEETAGSGAPTMARSRGQLGSSYAPGAFFTFEGGLGSCIAIPDLDSKVDEAPIDDPTKSQILLRLREIWQTWFTRGFALNETDRIIDPRQCLDEALIRGGSVAPLGGHQVEFVSPLRIGYAPAPLTLVCNKCQTFKSFRSAYGMSAGLEALKKLKCETTEKKRACQWRQLDVIFVHWSGDWMPATPGRWEWNDRTGQPWLSGERCAMCDGDEFKLNTASPRIGQWHFYCAKPGCGYKASDEWRQNDQFTTAILRTDAGKRNSERRMEPISYRASSAFYAQSEQFVVFAKKDHKLLSLLEPERRAELEEFIATKYRLSGGSYTRDEMKSVLLTAGHAGEWQSMEAYERMLNMAESSKDSAMVSMVTAEIQKLVGRWTSSDPSLLPPKTELPSGIVMQIAMRAEYTSRYDPFVLAVEHEALWRGKLSAPAEAGRSPFVRFNHLDNDLAPKDAGAKKRQEDETTALMRKLGLAELGLVREFELCRFTHGYSRVSPIPTMEKRNQLMPVRLKLFDPLRSGKRPIYVVTQENEALYVQLDPQQVFEWLTEVGVHDMPDWKPADGILFGGKLLETAQPFGRYFSRLREEDASTYRYVYTLLHTYAHTFMKNVAELSGLDLGSMGEYIFPADLAFVVYRNGTTMDLGNLSSLWRNENNRFLRRLLEASSHRCNSGRLCDVGGGACPDCIMVPETSCIAGNQLLSRAVLNGGPAPREDRTHKGQRITGFLEVVNHGTSP